MSTIQLQVPPDQADSAAIIAGLRAFCAPFIGTDVPHHFALMARNDDGEMEGGLIGYTRWDRLWVESLWVAESARGRGLGSRLLQAAEAEAIARGMKRAWLDTTSFQARPFYEKHGYHVFAQQDDYPPGFTQYFMRKDLKPR